MIFRLFRRNPAAGTIATLYGVIVAQARRPAFYLIYGVPDTAEGRFDMILLHMALVCRRLGAGGAAENQTKNKAVSQGVFDMFCRDMDHNLREMGVSDLGVPKKMQRLGEAFYGRLDAYDRALGASDDAELVAALGRNVLDDASPAASRRLAAYARAAVRTLDAMPIAELAEGHLSFPDPDTVPAAEAQP